MESESKDKRVPVTLRLPPELVAQIDQLRGARAVSVPRNTWISEAIAQKLETDEARGRRKHGAK